MTKKLFTMARVKQNPNAMAIRWAMESDAPNLRRLRAEAKTIVLEALEDAGGNLVRAAADLGLDRRTLQRWMIRFPDLGEARLAMGGGKVGRPHGSRTAE